MVGEARLTAVSGQGACLHCTAWDHVKHRAPGGGQTGDPKCRVKVAGADCGG